MKRLVPIFLLASISSACLAVVKVVSTTPDLASIVAAVGGKYVSVSALVTGARDPHRIEAKPSFMSKVAGTDLFVAIGLDLEVGYEQPILEGSRNSKVAIGAPGHLHASDWVQVLEKPSGPISRAMGDIHPGGNPHIWLDPYNGRIIATKIAAALAKVDPAHAKDYQSNLAEFLRRLDVAMFGPAAVERFGAQKLWEWQRSGTLLAKLDENRARSTLGGWAGKLAPFVGQPIITYHKSFSYFANRFGLKVVDELEPKPGIEPTPGHLASVIKTVQQRGVKAIVQETFYSPKHAQLVAARTGAKVVLVPQNVGHVPGASDYIALFDVIVDRLVEGLK
jgi:ABC-type Zn uptake system ZnuABC Zn-binding protein ZnuA